MNAKALVEKVFLGAVLTCAGRLTAAYVPVEWLQVSSANGQWINSKVTPACTDRIEMKVSFTTASGTQCLYCSRGNNTTANTYTSFLIGGKIRVDRNNAAGGSVDLTIAANTDYVFVADYNALTAGVSDGTTIKTLSNLTSGTFTPGSMLALGASHTAGTGLTDGADLGNFGSFKIYYVKLYDKNGNLKNEYVPVKDESAADDRCKVGLYETTTRRFCPNNGTGALACGAATGTALDVREEYVLTVAEGAGLALTAEHVQAAAGKTFVKAGGGSLYVYDDAMRDFPGDIRVRDGYYVLQSTNALGTAVGQTFVEDGGTLVCDVSVGKTDGTACAFFSETIHLKGNGCGGWGALQGKKTCTDFCRQLVFDGPVLVVANARLDWRSSTLDMMWYPLEVKAGSGGFLLVNETISHMGDIDVKEGYLELQANVLGCEKSAHLTIRENASFGFWNCMSWICCQTVFESNTVMKCGNGTFKYAGTDNRSIFYEQPVTLQGPVKNDLATNTQYQIRSKLTGDGRIWGGRGGYFQLLNDKADNDLKGGFDLVGVVKDGNPVGGLVAYYNGNIPAGEGAAPLKLKDAILEQRNQPTFNLPDVVADGRVVVSNMATVTSCMAKSLKKTGAAELTVFGPFAVAGTTAVDAGTLRLATKVPEGVPGLKWTYRNAEAGITSAKDMGVDLSGAAFAYKEWDSGKDMAYTYSGYVRVPGEAGADVVCNFMTSIARGCKVTIGGVLCCEFNDNKNVKDNISVGYARLAMYKPVTLKAGWQTISITMNNWWDTTRGPQANTGLGWEANFGIGVDWQCRSVTNTAYYAKLLDPGDGSFLRATLDVAQRQTYLTESKYRATFAGDVAFGPGAVFDIGDAVPYWPVTVPSLTGCPTVRNGALNVTSGTWTLRKDDLTGAVPLTVGANAAMTFPATVTIAGDAEALAYGKTIKARPLVAVEAGGTFGTTTFVLSDAMKGAGYSLHVVDGVPCLEHVVGLTLIIR